MSPREPEPATSAFARNVADAIAAVIEQRGISKRELARAVGRSNNYIATRFRHEAAFTLTDIDMICTELGLDAGTLIATVHVGGQREDYRLAADDRREGETGEDID